MPVSVDRYFTPNTWAINPPVSGTVPSHRNPITAANRYTVIGVTGSGKSRLVQELTELVKGLGVLGEATPRSIDAIPFDRQAEVVDGQQATGAELGSPGQDPSDRLVELDQLRLAQLGQPCVHDGRAGADQVLQFAEATRLLTQLPYDPQCPAP